ncbi:telomere repeat-binding factor 4 [Phtheirospermum japonicum]|uniref:Telomere repeat-binding factor 4 n=1 Tax=Phtheirospermum japonicum TaxID=374723 RepID=A0A830BBP6_9LAMI|nr:telomere repeat-binding factor 4 [Phtheirospermum japonicum]
MPLSTSIRNNSSSPFCEKVHLLIQSDRICPCQHVLKFRYIRINMSTRLLEIREFAQGIIAARRFSDAICFALSFLSNCVTMSVNSRTYSWSARKSVLSAIGSPMTRYNAMIFDALSTLNGPNGLESAAIANFIEQRQEVPANFRRQLSSRLRRLVQQDKLEKDKPKDHSFNFQVQVQNYYKIKIDAQVEMKASTATTIQKDPQRPRLLVVQSIGYLGATVEEVAVSAAYKIAEAENKSFVAAESVREAERVSAMAEEMESLLQFAIDCYDQSARGEILLFA